jgi:hypothetical protein
MPRRREDPKPQLSYFTKSGGKLARVRATARDLSSVSNRDCSCARCERTASLRNALMRSCLIWMSLQGERAKRNRVFASRRRASRGSCVASRTPSSRSSFHTSSKSREKRARASGVNECRSCSPSYALLGSLLDASNSKNIQGELINETSSGSFS